MNYATVPADTTRQTDDSSPGFSAGSLTKAADMLLRANDEATHVSVTRRRDNAPNDDSLQIRPDEEVASRRLFFASSLVAAGTTLAAADSALAATTADDKRRPQNNALDKWEVTPVNKRTGVTIFDVEKDGYNVRFVTYLSRFLLGFDADCQRWWYNRAADISRTATAEQVNAFRRNQFGAFSASVEVGLQEYRQDNDGPSRLLHSLLNRYCPDPATLQGYRERQGLPPLSEAAAAKEQEEIREARRQIALLFALMEKNQPVQEITALLAAIENGSIAAVEVVDPGSGYAPGYGPPEVRFPPPEAGDTYERATGRAKLTPNGRILRIDVVNRGMGYTKQPPDVTISPPALIRFGQSANAETAQAKAILFRKGANKGRIERIQLTNPGAGYRPNEIIRVRFSPPTIPAQQGGVTATATAVLEYQLSEIKIVNNGTGYAVEKPIDVYVEPPPLTARINMNDPLLARIISPNEPLPSTAIASREQKQRMPDADDPTSVYAQVQAASRGTKSTGDCVGRACYDRPVVAIAYPQASGKGDTVFRAFRKIDEVRMETEQRVVSGSTSGAQGPPERPALGVGTSSSSQLLSLFPAGVGLEFNTSGGSV